MRQRVVWSGRDVVLGAKVEFLETGSYLEGVGDALLVGFPAVAATHELSLSRQEVKLIEKQSVWLLSLSGFCTTRRSNAG
jgi:hypothetical protein